MKTALYYLKEELENHKKIHNLIDIDIILGFLVNNHIALEKQQIIDAYHDGQEHGFNKFGNDAEKYFEDTFNLKQEL